MKKPNITSRDWKIFFLGMFIMLIINIIVDFKDLKKGFKDGFNAARIEHQK
jgi:hypothetical protein